MNVIVKLPMTRREHKAITLQERLPRIKDRVLNGMPITKACDEERLTWRTFVQYEELFTKENQAVMAKLKTYIKDRSNRHEQSKANIAKALEEVINGELIEVACKKHKVSLQAFRNNTGGCRGIAEKYKVQTNYTGVKITDEEAQRRIVAFKESIRNGKNKTESYKLHKIAAVRKLLSKKDIEEVNELLKQRKIKRTGLIVGKGT